MLTTRNVSLFMFAERGCWRRRSRDAGGDAVRYRSMLTHSSTGDGSVMSGGRSFEPFAEEGSDFLAIVGQVAQRDDLPGG